ncbi:pyridoxamine 5'-phosphate oxidase family protein [Microtetraspora sp. NBRC 16547]|uniref:pyridoxamine 5'-phosphate oxidase family protein n=1 Tax=Microtetraspora sp. NBRC 16547 TaxID=3030993 RepID=UPI0024A18536|nr:pyridoxamine 5'-phosphate oxidase family protein [Microtetraspora sp. NBRC 16547]GLW96226.1 oxidoreductase [Microtetraspora sp. NBRC 16547]
MRHTGEVAVQLRAGVRAENWGSAGTKPEIPEVAADFLAAQRMLVIGTAGPGGRVWAGPLTGPAGFATARGPRTVVIDALPGPYDPLAGVFDGDRSTWHSTGRDTGKGTGPAAGADTGQDTVRDTGHDIGLLAIEPRTRRRMRINGRARREGDGLVVTTEQVYANCPKYLQTRDVAEEPAHSTAVTYRTGLLAPEHREWIEKADTFFVATHADGFGSDVSHRGGNPGFVRVVDEHRLVWPDYVGNSMYMTLGNLELNPAAGLLFLDWTTGDALHLTGRARVDWDPGDVPGAQRLVEFDIDEVVQVGGASPLRWTFGNYSRFNPQLRSR